MTPDKRPFAIPEYKRKEVNIRSPGPLREEPVMQISVQAVGLAVVVDLEGRLTVETDTQELHMLVGQLARTHPSNVVLDLGHVSRIDCCGIGQLVQLHCSVRAAGGALRLANLTHRHKRLLELVGLIDVLRVFDGKKDALASFGAAAGRVRHVSFGRAEESSERGFTPRPRIATATPMGGM